MSQAVARRRRPESRRNLMTLYEYFQTPETVLPQELIHGVVRVAESPSPIHQHIVGNLFILLHSHLIRYSLGKAWLAPLDVILDADAPLVVQPDLFVILSGGAAVVQDRVYGPPDLVIEVLSPRPRIGELAERLEWFRDYGVREVWLVHQLTGYVNVLRYGNRRLVSEMSHRREEVIESAVLPDFGYSLATIVGT